MDKYSKLLKFLKDNDIQLILWDVDDTLVYTHEVFHRHVNEAVRIFCSGANKTFEEVYPAFKVIENHVREWANVNPDKLWTSAFYQLAHHYPIQDHAVLDQCFEELNKIYTQTLRPIEGALEIIEFLNIHGVSQGIVTHADREWNDFKLKGAGFNPENFTFISAVDVNYPKEALHWCEAYTEIGINPSNVLAIGNNLRSDILPAREAGIEHLILLVNENSNKSHFEGSIPDGVIIARDPSQILSGECFGESDLYNEVKVV